MRVDIEIVRKGGVIRMKGKEEGESVSGMFSCIGADGPRDTDHGVLESERRHRL